jgi:hypothetical protein
VTATDTTDAIASTASDALGLRVALRGGQRAAVRAACILYRDALEKLHKRQAALGLDPDETIHRTADTERVLRQLGWSPPAKSVKPDDATGDLFEEPE